MENKHKQAVDWWHAISTIQRLEMLKKHGYQDVKKPWKYRPLDNHGIYIIWAKENSKAVEL